MSSNHGVGIGIGIGIGIDVDVDVGVGVGVGVGNSIRLIVRELVDHHRLLLFFVIGFFSAFSRSLLLSLLSPFDD